MFYSPSRQSQCGSSQMKTPLPQDAGPPRGHQEIRFPPTAALAPFRWKCGLHRSPWDETDQGSFSKKEKFLFSGKASKQPCQISILTLRKWYRHSCRYQLCRLSSAPAGQLDLYVCLCNKEQIYYETDSRLVKCCIDLTYWIKTSGFFCFFFPDTECPLRI